MSKYRVTRTHTEIYCMEVDAPSEDVAINIASSMGDSEFDLVESSAYDYAAVLYDELD